MSRRGLHAVTLCRNLATERCRKSGTGISSGHRWGGERRAATCHPHSMVSWLFTGWLGFSLRSPLSSPHPTSTHHEATTAPRPRCLVLAIGAWNRPPAPFCLRSLRSYLHGPFPLLEVRAKRAAKGPRTVGWAGTCATLRLRTLRGSLRSHLRERERLVGVVAEVRSAAEPRSTVAEA